MTGHTTAKVTIDDYDAMYALWSRALIILTVMLLLLPCFTMPGLAEEESAAIHPNVRKAAEELSLIFGIEVPESIQAEESAWRSEELAVFDLGLGLIPQDQLLNDVQMRPRLLWALGCGEFGEEPGSWTPTSDKVYAFDAEATGIEYMYRCFLLGVRAIVPEVSITGIAEDLSGMDEDLEGTRSVSFLCNGHPYQFELPGRSGRFSADSIDLMNGVLEQEGCQYRLCVVSDPSDQRVILVYDLQQRARILKWFCTGR